MKAIVWKPRGSMDHHRSVKKFEFAEEHTSKGPVPGFGDLKPGESWRVNRDDSVKISQTDNDRITFSNGASIHEVSGEYSSESGVLTRMGPDGEQLSLDGTHAWIDPDDRSDEFQPAIFFRVEDQFGDYNDWKQTFPAEGGMTLNAPEGEDGLGMPSFQLSADGKLTAQFEHFGYEGTSIVQADARLEGEALVAKDGSLEFGISPPVPVEWLIGG
jgi:hypothetical protein